ncbi:DnaA regulatory inactivator Hda [Candidatus Pelagadaptatus aseana]|uniref:DnaA regulatory inactivator Hda n=1 Tax=Candidatus Pelagadaptatus aseana TaxID=3120508 RepID=UPI003C6ED5A0
MDSGSYDSAPRQLALDVGLTDDATFDNYYLPLNGGGNAQVVEQLKVQLQPFGEQSIFLWGAQGVGVTHLLQAACLHASQRGFSAIYLALDEQGRFQPDAVVDGLEHNQLVCLDNVDAVLGQPRWETALFHLFNRVRDLGGRMLWSAACGPHELAVSLPDLASRLSWGLVFQVQPLSDDDKMDALAMRARNLGLELSPEVAQFIQHRCSRNLGELYDVLRRLDQASLSEQRRLTVPFVKQVLGI